MNIAIARLLVRALILLNDRPRFGPRNRRFAFDSYSVASEIEGTLKQHGWDWRTQELQPPPA